MTLQQKQLDDLAEWLAKTEERIATQESLGSDLAQIREQVDEHKVWLLYKIMWLTIGILKSLGLNREQVDEHKVWLFILDNVIDCWCTRITWFGSGSD